MRVTQSMLTNNMLRSLSDSYNRMEKYQNQVTSGKKITRPSDDPVVAIKGVSLRTNLKEIEQFKSNIDEAYTWMESTDDALANLTDVFQRMSELSVQANGTTSDKDLDAIAAEVKQLIEQVDTIASTKIGTKYLFNGQKTTTKPELDGTNNDNSDVKLELSPGIEIAVNVKPNQIFSNQLKQDLDNFYNALTNNDVSSGDFTDNINAHLNNIISVRSEYGAKYNRVELLSDRLNSQEVSTLKLISNNEDVDMALAITKLTEQESIHRAALSVGARIIQPSLIDFLR